MQFSVLQSAIELTWRRRATTHSVRVDTSLLCQPHERRLLIRRRVRSGPSGTNCLARLQVVSLFAHDGLASKSGLVYPVRRDQAILLDTSVEVFSTRIHDGDAEMSLFGTGSAFAATGTVSAFTTHHPFFSQWLAISPWRARPGSSTDHLSRSYARRGALLAATAHCGLCLDPGHRVESELLMAYYQERQTLLTARKVSFQKYRTAPARGRTSMQCVCPANF